MELRLVVTSGPLTGRVVAFPGATTFVVGRALEADLRPDDQDHLLSRRHCRLDVDPPRCRLTDLGSRNGTFVNGRRVAAADLSPGDVIVAGHTAMRLEAVGATDPTAAAPPPTGVEPAASGTQFLPVETHHGDAPSADDSARLDGLLLEWLSRVQKGEVPAAEDIGRAAAPHRLGPPRDRIPAPRGWAAGRAPARPADRSPDLPGYRLVRELGRGGMGVVYLADRLAGNRPVAVKTIRPAAGTDPLHVQLFLREADILRQLDHPNVVRFDEMGEADGVLFFVMEYVEGTDAGQWLRAKGRLPPRTAVRLASQALEGLEYAHGLRFVHRDIKPANLLVGGASGARRVKLADFGLARVYQASQVSGLTTEGQVRGTPAYMPPEQVSNFREVKPTADVYSLAATLYQLLAGAPVHDFRPGESPFAVILNDDPVPLRDRNPDVPANLAKVVHRGLARDPARRWPSAAAFRKALSPFAR
jgi:serine/threonine-protein kinase